MTSRMTTKASNSRKRKKKRKISTRPTMWTTTTTMTSRMTTKASNSRKRKKKRKMKKMSRLKDRFDDEEDKEEEEGLFEGRPRRCRRLVLRRAPGAELVTEVAL